MPYNSSMPKTVRKEERLEARVSAQLKERILLAATIEGKDLTEFYVDKLSKAADQVIAEHANWKLSQADSEAFVNALLAPQPPAPRLVDLHLPLPRQDGPLTDSLDDLRIEPLDPDRHERSSFCSGVPSLDRYLRELAGQELRRRTAAIFVLVDSSSPQVLGYYSLSQSSLELTALPARLRKKLPRYPLVPATLLGRLAVDQNQQGRGHGDFLLMDALYRAWSISPQVGSFAVVVDVLEIEPDPPAFYLRYGFQPLPDRPRRLFLTLNDYEKALAENYPESMRILESRLTELRPEPEPARRSVSQLPGRRLQPS